MLTLAALQAPQLWRGIAQHLAKSSPEVLVLIHPIHMTPAAHSQRALSVSCPRLMQFVRRKYSLYSLLHARSVKHSWQHLPLLAASFTDFHATLAKQHVFLWCQRQSVNKTYEFSHVAWVLRYFSFQSVLIPMAHHAGCTRGKAVRLNRCADGHISEWGRWQLRIRLGCQAHLVPGDRGAPNGFRHGLSHAGRPSWGLLWGRRGVQYCFNSTIKSLLKGGRETGAF